MYNTFPHSLKFILKVLNIFLVCWHCIYAWVSLPDSFRTNSVCYGYMYIRQGEYTPTRASPTLWCPYSRLALKVRAPHTHTLKYQPYKRALVFLFAQIKFANILRCKEDRVSPCPVLQAANSQYLLHKLVLLWNGCKSGASRSLPWPVNRSLLIDEECDEVKSPGGE